MTVNRHYLARLRALANAALKGSWRESAAFHAAVTPHAVLTLLNKIASCPSPNDWNTVPTALDWGSSSRALPDLWHDNKVFWDGDNVFCGPLVSHLYALSKSEEEWAPFFAWCVALGFRGVRIFAGELEQVNQTAESARAALPAYLRAAYSYGLMVEVTVITGSAAGHYDPRAHLEACVDIALDAPGVIIIELANEVGHGSQSVTEAQLREWGDEFCADLVLWSVGAPVNTDEPTPDGEWPCDGGTHQTVHLDRGRPYWANIRRVREIYAVADTQDTPVIDNERRGAGEEATGSRENDPTWFFTAGVLDRGFGALGTHHSQSGLDAVVPAPDSWQQKCAEAEVEGSRLASEMLGGQRGAYYNAGHEGSPVGTIPQEDWDRTFGKLDGRCYSFTAGNSGLTVALGLPAGETLNIPWANGWLPTEAPVVRTSMHDGSRVEVWEISR